MQTRENRRGYEEHFVSGRHLNLNDLKQEAQHLENQYLYKENIPNSPKPEFRVTRLKHDTDRRGLRGIRMDEGFKDPYKGVLSWWSLAVGHEEVKSAEKRLLQQKFSNLTDDEVAMHPSFLYKFTSSPAFSEKSRLGSYRFTFNLEDVLEAYSQQFCSGDQPVMRVYETVLHKQEVQHTVLVHSPANQKLFSEYPLLSGDRNAVCVYKDDRFIWRPYAMCNEHRYELKEIPDENQMYARKLTKGVYYIWDNVAIALHVGKEVLKFDADQLRKNLKFCQKGKPVIGTFDSFEDAKNQVNDLWPLEEECSLEQHFTDPDLRLVLVGRTGSGKSSSGNIILGRDAFSTGGAAADPPIHSLSTSFSSLGLQESIPADSGEGREHPGQVTSLSQGAAAGNVQCCLQTQIVYCWNMTVVDTPGFSETPEVKTEIRRCVDMLAPGPHAFLLVIKVGPQMYEEQDTVRQMEEIFGENVWSHTYVVLTYKLATEDQVSVAKARLKEILPQRVGDRIYTLNINDRDSWHDFKLLNAVENMVIANRRRFYSV